MVQNQLVAYIQGLVNQGYDATTIRNYLINSGWPPNYIDQAMQYVQFRQPEKNPGINLVIVIISVIGLIILGIGGFFLLSDSNPEQLLDYRVNVLEKKVEKGGSLSFSNTLTNMGSSSRYDVFLTYTIRDTDGKKVDTWKESKAVTTVAEYETRRDLSGIDSGSYELDVIINYRGGNASGSDTFTIYEPSTCNDGVKNQGEAGVDCGGPCEPCDKCKDGVRNQGEEGVDCGGPCEPCDETCSDGIKNQGEEGVDCGGPCSPCNDTCGECDDGNICTKGVCIDGECYYKEIVPCCGNGVCEEGEDTSCEDCKEKELTSAEIKEGLDELKDDQDVAGEFCSEISAGYKKDFCFRSLAHSVGNKHFCNYIDSSSVADFCYLKFGSNGDGEACKEINNKHMRQSCENLND